MLTISSAGHTRRCRMHSLWFCCGTCFLQKCDRLRRLFLLKIAHIQKIKLYQSSEHMQAQNEKKFQFITEWLATTLQFYL
ncbi:hypothetical protein GH784_11310 [Agrobacterium sp. CNPSo 675]|nr:hypothetical protein [Agrobacterium tumefaciens]